MKILLEVSDKKKFIKKYSKISKDKNAISITEDSVSYGVSDYLVIGCIFLFESSLSGLTWDYIKNTIYPYIETLFDNKSKDDHISIYIKDVKEKYSLDIPNDYKSLDIKIPKKLELKIRK